MGSGTIPQTIHGRIEYMTLSCYSSGNATVNYGSRAKWIPLRCIIQRASSYILFNGWTINPIFNTSGTFVGTSACANETVELVCLVLS